MKSLQVVEGQKWRTYQFDPTLVTPQARTRVANYRLNTRTVLLMPGAPGTDSYVDSDDPKVNRFKRKVGPLLTSMLPSEVDGTGCFGRNGVSSNFMSLLTANKPMFPSIPPIPTNEPTRKERGLVDGWVSPAHKRIFEELAKEMTSAFVPESVKVSDHSTSGHPHFTVDALEKKRLFLERLPNVNEILDLATSGKLEDLYNKYQILICYRMSSRRQADSKQLVDGKWRVKQRLVPDLAFALSDGKRGSIRPATRFNQVDPEIDLCRLRSVYGLSVLANLLLGVTFDGFNQFIFKEFAATFKSHGPADIAHSINQWDYHQAIDVKDHDFLVPWFILEVLFNRLREVLDERLVKFTEMCWQAPAYVPHPDIYGKPRPFWLGHPLNKEDFGHRYGLPSGIFHVAFAGKFGCMGVYLCQLHDAGIPVVGRVGEILRWQHPDVALLDCGDDAVACFRTEKARDVFRAIIEKPVYYTTGPEPLGYLGHTMWREIPGEGLIRVSLRPESYVINPWVRERGLDSTRFSPFWARGVDARESTFSAIPNYGTLREIIRRSFRDEFGYDYDAAVKSHPNYRRPLPVLTPSSADIAVLDDPNKLHYRFDSAQISPEILNLFTKKITVEEYLPHVKHLIKATLK